MLQTRQPYILDLRTAQATPTPPPTEVTTTKMLARYVAQPPLDVFHRQTAKAMATAPDVAVNVPVIF